LKNIKELIKQKYLIIDGAMGTEIQKKSVPDEAWQEKHGCNELLNETAPDIIGSIHKAYLTAGADIIKTNSFGCLPWVLDEFEIGDKTYDLSRKAAQIVKKLCDEYSTVDKPRFVAGSIGPGTKLPSLGHMHYDEMIKGYKEAVRGVIDGGADLILLETCQDPLQIKCALNACEDVYAEKSKSLPIMVSATIEIQGSMLIGTNAETLAVILEPFDILSLGFNCGTGPEQVATHLKNLSAVWNKAISVHSNAGLPQNRGGYTFYPMGPDEFAEKQAAFGELDGVAILGGCCGTTPQHILALCCKMEGRTPRNPKGEMPRALASLFESVPLKLKPAPLYIGERSNATGSKAFRELILAADYEAAFAVANEQVRAGAHVLDVSVAFAGRDETNDMREVVSRYAGKLTTPLMPDSTQSKALEEALKLIGGRPIINSVNLEDGEEKFDIVCSLARRYGSALVCLVIDEKGMAKTKEDKLKVAGRIYERAVGHFGLNPADLVFDMLTFTVGSGDSEYFSSAIDTIEAIREFGAIHPEVGFTLGVSNVSFGLDKHSREYLNSVFLHHCVEAGLSTAIVNVKNIIPYFQIGEVEKQLCEDLIFDRRKNGHDPLGVFINHFASLSGQVIDNKKDDLEGLDTRAKLHKLLLNGDKDRMLLLLPNAKDEIDAETIINEVLIGAMKDVGELFGSGKMQLPFVLQSAETMKASVDFLSPYLPKKKSQSQTTIILGTVKGDVHDVGKNLVDIILTNNGFKVVNIGIKADISLFIEELKKHNAHAIGMSGLLVKSTLVMKESLEELKRQGISVPVLLGGAALNRAFIDEHCQELYDGPVIYAKDAFDAIDALSKLEKGELTKDAPRAKSDYKAQTVEIDPDKIIMPSTLEPPIVKNFGRFVMHDENIKKLAFEWLNKRALFKDRWGYKARGIEPKAYEEQIRNEVEPNFERLKKQFLEEGLFEPVAIYGVFKAKREGNSVFVHDKSESYEFLFPRSTKSPHRCISDFFREDKDDVVAMSVVSVGTAFDAYAKRLHSEGKFHEYHLATGLASELAETLAEIVHKKVRIELNITQNEKPDLNDVKMMGYTGCRYSFGYPACPDVALNEPLFALLKPEEFGVELTESHLIYPEQSTSAFIVAHSEAGYFSI